MHFQVYAFGLYNSDMQNAFSGLEKYAF